MKALQVYVQRRGKRPELVPDAKVTGRIPGTFIHDDQTFYFVTADLSQATITFHENKPMGDLK